MNKLKKLLVLVICVLLIFSLYLYKIFKDIKYEKHLSYAINNLYCLNQIQKNLYDNYINVYKEAINKNCSFNTIYSNDAHRHMKELNIYTIRSLKNYSINDYVFNKIKNPSKKYKNQYKLFLDSHKYYTENLNKFNLDPNAFKESDYTDFIPHFKELETRLSNLMSLLEIPEYNTYYN